MLCFVEESAQKVARLLNSYTRFSETFYGIILGLICHTYAYVVISYILNVRDFHV